METRCCHATGERYWLIGTVLDVVGPLLILGEAGGKTMALVDERKRDRDRDDSVNDSVNLWG